ncbi:UDP-N-acetylmuramate dehydrogenase [Porticoccus sp. W117]|uniref:UDP-N-acetylmuramate dehydrogenase n=1 Tax=Porticoccus sp. W117 TaxID=3054777 RepID=UPI0025927DDB|nr:UDP-N-acetylmuramate dehydrogenase [Porticoccus sp. W117]MDM3872126.1 UDP-N-acetylmuramate dehydrogenase [Porticoccus sp. W117]
MHIQSNINLKPYNTLALPALAEQFVSVHSTEQLCQALVVAKQQGWLVTILGGGSNLVLAADISGLVIQIAIPGVETVGETESSVQVKVGAGEDWHQFVQLSLQNGWYGLENLSLIPGMVGAAPVQNIGAYGVELAEHLVSVDIVDLQSGEQKSLNRQQCQFGYRDSIFKNALKNRAAIVSVTLELLKTSNLKLSYPALQQAVEDIPEDQLTPQKVSELVCQIRRSKLPDPASEPNAGSFFKNPVVSTEKAQQLQQQYPELVAYPLPDGNSKLAAGWLIEKAGWKGRRIGDIAIHHRQALVMVNCGTATGEELLAVAGQVVESVKETFGVELEMEPRVLPEALRHREYL